MTTTAPAAPPRKIKTAIIVDVMGGGGRTAEEEIEEHKRKFSAWLAPDIPEFHTPHYAAEGEHGIQPGTELVCYDYGGLMPGNDLMETNARDLINWAEEHPNALVIVVSAFTFSNLVKPDMEARGLTLPNIIGDDSMFNCPIPEWWLGHPAGEWDPFEEDKPTKLRSPKRPRFSK